MKKLGNLTIGFIMDLVGRIQKAALKAAESVKFWTWAFITWAYMTHRLDLPTLEYLGFTAAIIGIGAWRNKKAEEASPEGPPGQMRGFGR